MKITCSRDREAAQRALERIQSEGDFDPVVNEPVGRTGAWVEFGCECGGVVRLESTRMPDGFWTKSTEVHL